jgi:uncharacterized protein (TIGR02265 family)
LLSRFASIAPNNELPPEDFSRFAALVADDGREQSTITHNLATFPAEIRSRGVFFEGVAHAIIDSIGEDDATKLMDHAGVLRRTVPFRFYPHREFYRLYYLAASVLERGRPMPTALRNLARTFFPIFRSSLLGKTMSAFMGNDPNTIFPLLAKAYNLSVESNHHVVDSIKPRELQWTAEAEPVAWYAETLMGIVEGAMPAVCTPEISLDRSVASGTLRKYVFRIRW